MTREQIDKFNSKNKKCTCRSGEDHCQWCVDQIFKKIGRKERECIEAHADKMREYKK